MPSQKQLKAGLEGLVVDGATSRSLADNTGSAPAMADIKTGKTETPERTGDFGACCKFGTAN